VQVCGYLTTLVKLTIVHSIRYNENIIVNFEIVEICQAINKAYFRLSFCHSPRECIITRNPHSRYTAIQEHLTQLSSITAAWTWSASKINEEFTSENPTKYYANSSRYVL